MTSLVEMARFAPRVAQDLGVEIREHDVRVMAHQDAVRLTMRLPYTLSASAEIDGRSVALDPSSFVDAVYACQSKLFAQVAAHMREHNYDPHSRLTQMTELVGRLVKKLAPEVDLRPHNDVRALLDDVKAILRAPSP